MNTIIVVENNRDDLLRLKEILEDDYHVVMYDEISQIDAKQINDQVVAIIICLDFASKENITKYSNLKNKYKIPLIVGGDFTGNLFNLLALGVSEVILKPYNKAIVKLRISNTISVVKSNEYRIIADLDALTKIYNRQAFYREAHKLINNNKNINYDLVCFDIDRFKIINDIYGSSVGDALLVHLATTGIKRMKQHQGLIGRLSGDLFVIVVPHQDNIEEILLQEMNEDINSFNLGIRIVISFGYYNIDDLSLPISRMCDRAMMAIKKVKDTYKTSYAIYDEELRNQVLEEQLIIDEMARALQNDEFIPYYQPKFNMVTKTYIGYEALMRWLSPKRGLISPASFIPIFEKNGFISKLDYVIWDKVCKDMSKTRSEGRILLPVSVNVSRIELYDFYLGERILDLLEEYAIPIELFQLEITETAYMQDSDQMIEAVNKLKKLGFTILMDDFGSGFSSLNILKELPFDVIKIDLAFLEHLDGNNKAEKILKSVIQMARRLNMQIIAEGVETKQQEEFLVELGCNRAQGYLFARPMPFHEILEMIDSGDISIGDKRDDDYAVVNIDEILSTVHQQGEIDWYRQALLELEAQIFEYDFKGDNMIIFDTPIKDGDSNLVKMEIPNYSYNVLNGRMIHPKDIKKYQSFFAGTKEFKLTYRRRMINRDNGYVWVKDTGRTFYDENGEPKLAIGVNRVISDEKLNEQMMQVLSVMEQSTNFDSSINFILAEIGNDFSIDHISLLLEEDRYHSSYFWQDTAISVGNEIEINSVVLNEIANYFTDSPIMVLNQNDKIPFTNQVKKNILLKEAQTIVIIALYDDGGEIIGCMLFSMITSYRRWRNDELSSLQELTKGINVYLNKERVFNHLDSIILIYNQILEKLNDSILMFTYEQQPKLLFVNEACRKLLGMSNIDQGKFLEIYQHCINKDTQTSIHQKIKKCVETGCEQILDHMIKINDDQVIQVKTIFTLSPVKEKSKPIIISITTKQ